MVRNFTNQFCRYSLIIPLRHRKNTLNILKELLKRMSSVSLKTFLRHSTKITKLSNTASPYLSITIYRHTCQALNPHRFRKRIAQWRQVFARAYFNSYMLNLIRSFSKAIVQHKKSVSIPKKLSIT